MKNYEHLGGYYGGQIGDHNTYSTEVWDYLISEFKIKNMIDVGCGEGISLEYFIKNKVLGVGIEGLPQALIDSRVKEHIILHDFNDGLLKLNETFDLCWCCEFVEHVDEEYKDNFLDIFKKCKIIAMTHAVPGQPGHHHVNCQNSDYWITEVEKLGYKYDDELSLKLRNITNAVHVKNTLMIFIKNN